MQVEIQTEELNEGLEISACSQYYDLAGLGMAQPVKPLRRVHAMT